MLSHNSGLFFCGILIFALIQARYLSRTRLNLLFFGVCGFLTISYAMNYLIAPGGTRVIGGDFRYPFLLINFSITLFLLLRNRLTEPTNISILFKFLCTCYSYGWRNYEYEHLNQVLILLNIIILANMLKASQNRVIITATMFFFVVLTYATGMYSGLNNTEKCVSPIYISTTIHPT